MKLEKFKALGLSEESITEIAKKGFEEPTEIQIKAIPLVLNTKKDMIGQAQTGTGKTAAFGLPVLEKLEDHTGYVQALILVPTRELAIQVAEELNSFKGKKKLQILPIYGGQAMTDQIRRLKQGIDIVVGTPGRIMDHMKRKTLALNKISFAVLDEADEMLNMGFVEDIEEIFSKTNPDKRTLLFSATLPDHIMKIAKTYMREFEIIATKKDKLTTEQTEQIYFEVSPQDRLESLCRIIDMENDFFGIVFCRTKIEVDQLANKLIDRGYEAEGIHGDLSQSQRERTLEKFKKKKINILAATDVAARGIDVSNLTHVINYALPQDPESYVHRIGRTGRAGKKGIAITFISPSEYRKLVAIMRITKSDIRKEKVPKVKDIINAKKVRLATDLQGIIDAGIKPEYLDTAKDLLNGKEPLDILGAILQHTLLNELDLTSYAEINESSVDRKGTTRLFVAMGKKDGMDPKKLLTMIEKEAGVKGNVINDVTIKDNFSFLTVPFKEAELIILKFKEHQRQNRPLVYEAKESKGSDSGFKGSKGGYKGGSRGNSNYNKGASSSGGGFKGPRKKSS